MIYKLKIVEEELDESMYWIELYISRLGGCQVLTAIYNEANELISIIVASIKTLKRKNQKS